jgi:hypothetical protein
MDDGLEIKTSKENANRALAPGSSFSQSRL